jgi:hypothetical protein
MLAWRYGINLFVKSRRDERSLFLFFSPENETVCFFSETLASTDECTRRQNQEQHDPLLRRENLKPHKSYIIVKHSGNCGNYM